MSQSIISLQRWISSASCIKKKSQINSRLQPNGLTKFSHETDSRGSRYPFPVYLWTITAIDQAMILVTFAERLQVVSSNFQFFNPLRILWVSRSWQLKCQKINKTKKNRISSREGGTISTIKNSVSSKTRGLPKTQGRLVVSQVGIQLEKISQTRRLARRRRRHRFRRQSVMPWRLFWQLCCPLFFFKEKDAEWKIRGIPAWWLYARF